MLNAAYHRAQDTPKNPGVVGLATEIRRTPTKQLVEQARLLLDTPEPLATMTTTRLNLVLRELQHRQQGMEGAA